MPPLQEEWCGECLPGFFAKFANVKIAEPCFRASKKSLAATVRFAGKNGECRDAPANIEIDQSPDADFQNENSDPPSASAPFYRMDD